MTNADKYNLTKEQIKEIAQEIDIIYQNDEDVANVEQATIVFFNKPAKPTLTEEERVILKVLQKFHFNYILGRKNTTLYGYDKFEEDGERHITNIPSIRIQQLFQFIKNGEEYEIKELLGE
ncbi:MAG: hypothetical protein J6T10_24510 [Methanobrevibacter sp.]|nr:hypothetical protein [Methanobrevibacter sp.]